MGGAWSQPVVKTPQRAIVRFGQRERRRRTAAFGPFPDAQDFEREIGEVARSANSPKD